MNGKKNQGFTLIEMLVTLLIGTVLLLALGAVMSGIGQSQQRVEDYESIQETLRFTTAMLSRSLRTADKLVNETGAETNNTQISLQREARAGRFACNGANSDEFSYPFFKETYYLDQSGKLMCRVGTGEPITPSNPVTLGYDIASVNFECLLYDATAQNNFSSLTPCGSVNNNDLGSVIAVRTTITFDPSEFKQLKNYAPHSFVTTLRTRLNACANHSGSGCPEPDEE